MIFLCKTILLLSAINLLIIMAKPKLTLDEFKALDANEQRDYLFGQSEFSFEELESRLESLLKETNEIYNIVIENQRDKKLRDPKYLVEKKLYDADKKLLDARTRIGFQQFYASRK